MDTLYRGIRVDLKDRLGIRRHCRATVILRRVPLWPSLHSVKLPKIPPSVPPTPEILMLPSSAEASGQNSVRGSPVPGQRLGNSRPHQHSTKFTARPPRLVSLYFERMSLPVWRIVSITASRETTCLPSPRSAR